MTATADSSVFVACPIVNQGRPPHDTRACSKSRKLADAFQERPAGKYVHAVDDVSIELYPGEIVGLVGESGCGKSTLGRTIVGLEKATSGRVLLDGVDLCSLSGAALRRSRRALQYVFQDPYSSLNDRQTVGETIDEALLIDGTYSLDERSRRTNELLDQVGLAHAVKDRHTRELSGGQRQRVAIARSLAVNPRVLICDEPVSALDLSIRAQVMNLFLRLQKDLGVACLFIAHDLALVRQAASRVYVMYLGKIVEHGRLSNFTTVLAILTRRCCWRPFLRSTHASRSSAADLC